jgi:hypothetical protein
VTDALLPPGPSPGASAPRRLQPESTASGARPPSTTSIMSYFTIFARDLTGKTIAIDGVHSGTSISEVKRRIHDKTGMDPGQIRLIAGGKEVQGCGPLDHPGKPMEGMSQTVCGRCRNLGDYDIRNQSILQIVLRLRGDGTYDRPSNTFQFAASDCTITCKQQLALPCLTVHIASYAWKHVHFLVEGSTVFFSDPKRVAGTISFNSEDPRIAEVEGSNILARSAGTTTVTATFSSSSPERKDLPENLMNTTCTLKVIVVMDT